MDEVTFVLHPGYVTSKNDGQIHFITANALARLYKIDRFPKKRVLVVRTGDRIPVDDRPEYVHLHTNYHGNYDLPANCPKPP